MYSPYLGIFVLMSDEDIIKLVSALAVIILLALWLAYYQNKRGYSFIKSFVSALIGLSALGALLFKLFFL